MIPIFKYEQEAGIAELVRSSGRLVVASPINPLDISSEQRDILKKILSSSAEANPNQFDLFYLESVLASIGWNKNDDVFAKEPSWNARNTPVDKKFNFMHNENDIIGHLTSSKVVGFDGKLIPNDTDINSVPDQFDIVVGAVIYRTWENDKQQERINTLIAEILENKWCVSMECLFRNFDYAIITPDNVHKVVARNDETSFLTKHLRIYGGSGEYDGNRVGRLLRNFTFSGKGLVDNPANPRSNITTTNDYREVSLFTGANIIVNKLDVQKEEFKMSDITKEQYDALQTQFDAVKAELDAIKASKAKAVENEIDELKTCVANLEKAKSEVEAKLVATEEVVKAKEENIESLKQKVSEAETKLTELDAKIKAQEIATIKATRKTALLAKVDEEKAQSLVDKFENVSDDLFNTLLESLPAKCMDDSSKDEKKEDKKAKKEAKASDEDDVNTDIDDAKASDDANMSTGGEDETADLCAKASSWFSDCFASKVTKSEEGE